MVLIYLVMIIIILVLIAFIINLKKLVCFKIVDKLIKKMEKNLKKYKAIKYSFSKLDKASIDFKENLEYTKRKLEFNIENFIILSFSRILFIEKEITMDKDIKTMFENELKVTYNVDKIIYLNCEKRIFLTYLEKQLLRYDFKLNEKIIKKIKII